MKKNVYILKNINISLNIFRIKYQYISTSLFKKKYYLFFEIN